MASGQSPVASGLWPVAPPDHLRGSRESLAQSQRWPAEAREPPSGADGTERTAERIAELGALPTGRRPEPKPKPKPASPSGTLRPRRRLSLPACRCLHLCLMISGQCLRRGDEDGRG